MQSERWANIGREILFSARSELYMNLPFLDGALAALPVQERDLFYRKYYYCQSTAQMAAELGLTERAVEGRLYRLRQGLRQKLGGELDD